MQIQFHLVHIEFHLVQIQFHLLHIEFHLGHIEFQLVQIEFDWCILSFNYEYKYLITLNRSSLDVINILSLFSHGKSFEKKN